MPNIRPEPQQSVFALSEIAATFPGKSDTMLLDRYLVKNPNASARIFRVYAPTPAHFHFHVNCDEFLYVISGTGMFWIDDPGHTREFRPGHLLAFCRGTVHAMPALLELPVVFLAIDVPLRDPADVVFVQSQPGTPNRFIREHLE